MWILSLTLHAGELCPLTFIKAKNKLCSWQVKFFSDLRKIKQKVIQCESHYFKSYIQCLTASIHQYNQDPRMLCNKMWRAYKWFPDTRDVGSIPGSGRFPREGNSPVIFAWKIPWAEEPGGLQAMGSQSQPWLSTQFPNIWFTEAFFMWLKLHNVDFIFSKFIIRW